MRYAIIPLLLLTLTACSTTRTAYYNAWEKFGYAKRERLVDDVKSARESQVDAKQQFASALDQFKSVVNFNGGDLEAVYNKLNKQYTKCEDQAATVHKRIDSVKNVAQALFTELKGEIGQMKGDPSLERSSQSLYDQTHRNYDDLVDRMDRAAATMDPVLQKFKNRVLFIKHNLNA